MSLQSDSGISSTSQCSDNLAKDCKAFYEKRLRLTHSVQDKWQQQRQVHPESNLSNQINRLRSELLSLAHLDNELFKNLLALNDKLEELKLQNGSDESGAKELPNLPDQEVLSEETTDEYDDEDIDEEVEMEDEFHNMYSSLPPTQILERAAQAVDDQPSSSGLDMMGGLKFMLRSRSFLLRAPFHKKNTTNGRSRSRGNDSPFRTFDRIHENRVVEIRNTRSQSAERRTKKSAAASKLEAGSSATLTRGFHLPQSSRSLWQRVFVGSSQNGTAPSNGPESLPCSWSLVDGLEDKSPPPTLKHIKQNSFDSGIHTSDSSEYSIKI